MYEIIIKQCKIQVKDQPSVIFEDNVVCIRQMSTGFIKAGRTKHISLYIFSYTQDLVEK